VPIVTLLFEGGEDSVRSIYHDLRRNIPVIIINVRRQHETDDELVLVLIRVEHRPDGRLHRSLVVTNERNGRGLELAGHD
jgi:hypothetical protein